MPPTTNIRHASGWTVVGVTGELDIYTAPRLREDLIDLIHDGHDRLIINLDSVSFIDSTGLGVLIGALKRIRGVGGDLRVVATHDPVLRTMRVTGLHRVFGAYSTVDDAIGADQPLSPA